jgi:hypothetical protein
MCSCGGGANGTVTQGVTSAQALQAMLERQKLDAAAAAASASNALANAQSK